MTFNIDGTTIHCSDGSEGTIMQIGFYQDTQRDAWFVDLTVRCQETTVRGKLRFTSEGHERLPGRNDSEKASAVATKMARWISATKLQDGFFLRIDGDSDGVQIVEVSN